MKLETRDLRLLLSVARHGTLARAASELHLTPSALSHQLGALERELGSVLFQRSAKRMVATTSGTRLIETARETLESLERAENDVRRIASGREAVLRLSTQCYTCYHWLPRVLEPFLTKFPNVDVQVVSEATRYPLTSLLTGKLDLAVLRQPSPHRRIQFEPLFSAEVVAIMRPDHPLARKPFLTARDFEDQHLFVYTLPRDVNSVFSELLTPAGVSPRQVSEIQLTEAIVELVKAGLGISVFARWAVARELRAGSLRAIPITAEGWRRHWCAAYMRQKVTPPHIVEFVRLLKLHPPGGDGVVVAGRGRRTRPRVAPSGIDGAACSRSDSPGR